MRLVRGSGVVALSGMEAMEQISSPSHFLIRPLLEYSKSELLEYLETHHYPYFIDSSNSDEKYERNYFRKHFSTPLIEKYKEGIARSFEYMLTDKKELLSHFEELLHHEELYIIQLLEGANISQIADIYLKKLGYVLSASQRFELKDATSVVVGGKFVVEVSANRLFIAPYEKICMSHEFKERCRVAKIPPKVRGYLFNHQIEWIG